MRTISRHALGAKNIRAELKAAFPGVKFRVRSESFAGGGSVIDIEWGGGPTKKIVEEIGRKYESQKCNDPSMDYWDVKKGARAWVDLELQAWHETHGCAMFVHGCRCELSKCVDCRRDPDDCEKCGGDE